MNLNKKCFFRILLFAGLILNSFDSNAQLNGTYTIGGTMPSYANFSAAVSALTTNGVSGPVVFNVRNGVYNEQLNIGAITGASSVNTVTFQSETGDSTLVSLTYASTSTNNYTVCYNGCDYLTFRKMSVIATGTTYATVFRFETGSLNCGIDRCILQGFNTTTSNSLELSIVYCNSSPVTNAMINGNKILYGTEGIYFSSSTSGVKIIGNTFTGQRTRGINMFYLSSLTVSRNTITNTPYNGFEAIRLYSCGVSLVLTKNKINIGDVGTYGIYLNECIATSGTRGLVANNFISASGLSGFFWGIYHNNSSYINYYYNSINVIRAGTAYPFYCTGGFSEYNQVQNNIFSNSGGGRAIYTEYASSITVCDYNDLYTSGASLGYYSGTSCTNLASWRTSSGKDAHSVSVLPGFWNLTDLHVCNASLNNLAIPLTVVVDDIDGQSRSVSTPDIGADEFSTTLSVNLGPDIITCTNVTLDAGNIGSVYLWSTGSTSQTISVSTPGNYWVQVSSPCGAVSDTVNISKIPPVPGTITGPVSLCSNQTGNIYSVSAVNGASTYTWSVPAGWSITSGSGTNSVTVTTGVSSGNICVTAGSGCASSLASCKAITITDAVSTPGTITGNSTVCSGGTGINYSISSVSGATSYSWTVPSGWTITSGQGTTDITVTAGTSGGDVCVTASNSCFTSTQTCQSIVVTGVVSAPSSITGNATVCSGETGLNYSVNPVSGATSYTWTVPSGWTISSGQGTTGITVTAGTTDGDVCVTASNSCFASTQTCKSIVVIGVVSAPSSITGNVTVCSGETGLNYSVNPVSGATTYTWTVPSGWTINSGQGTTGITVTAGTSSGDICVTASNSCFASTPFCQTIAVTDVVSAPGSITGNTNVCSGETGIDYSISPVSGATSYTWTIPSGWAINSGQGTTNITITAGSSSGDVCVMASNSCFTSTQACQAISVTGQVSAPESISGNTIVCSNVTGNNYSTLAVSNATSYIWTVPSGWTISSGQGTTIIDVAAGSVSGDVCVSAINNCFSSSQVCNFVSILNIPVAPSSIFGPLSVCSGSADQQYSVLPVSGATEYIWTVPSGWLLTSGQGNNSITVNVGNTSGNLSVVAANICGSSNATSNMIVVNPEPQQPVITQNVDTLVSSASLGNQWYIDGILIAGAINQDYQPLQTGWYTVVFTDSNGCTSISNPMYFIYTNVNLNQANSAIEMYPNPSNGNIYFTFSGYITNNAVIEIYDLLGKKQCIHTLQIGSDPVSIETNLIPGLYNVNILVGNNSIRKKLIIR